MSIRLSLCICSALQNRVLHHVIVASPYRMAHDRASERPSLGWRTVPIALFNTLFILFSSSGELSKNREAPIFLAMWKPSIELMHLSPFWCKLVCTEQSRRRSVWVPTRMMGTSPRHRRTVGIHFDSTLLKEVGWTTE